MRLSESYVTLISSGHKFVSEAEQREAEYIAELRSAVLKKASMENFKPDMDQLESVMFEAYDRGIPLEEAKEKAWLAVYVDADAGTEEIE